MALTNAERQKRWRERRNELARVALAADGNQLSIEVMRDEWEDGARHVWGKHVSDDTLMGEWDRLIRDEVSLKRLSVEQIRAIVRKAGASWASNRFNELYSEWNSARMREMKAEAERIIAERGAPIKKVVRASGQAERMRSA